MKIKLYPVFEFGFAVCSFLVGSGIYLCLRNTNLEMFKIFSNGLPSWVLCLRSFFSSYDVPDFIKFSLPDGLWLFSYLLIIDSIWHDQKSKIYLFFLTILPTSALLSEVLQMFMLFPGVGDWTDILFYILSIVFFLIIKIYSL